MTKVLIFSEHDIERPIAPPAAHCRCAGRAGPRHRFNLNARYGRHSRTSSFMGLAAAQFTSLEKLNICNKNFQGYDAVHKESDVWSCSYRYRPGSDYVGDTSLKFMQYEYMRFPAVCSDFAAGDNPNSYGYLLGDAQSVTAAINAALVVGDHVRRNREFFTWDNVASWVLNHEFFSDTQLHAAYP
jgi:hypothetical protein